jgi:hypothetical protein
MFSARMPDTECADDPDPCPRGLLQNCPFCPTRPGRKGLGMVGNHGRLHLPIPVGDSFSARPRTREGTCQARTLNHRVHPDLHPGTHLDLPPPWTRVLWRGWSRCVACPV